MSPLPRKQMPLNGIVAGLSGLCKDCDNISGNARTLAKELGKDGKPATAQPRDKPAHRRVSSHVCCAHSHLKDTEALFVMLPVNSRIGLCWRLTCWFWIMSQDPCQRSGAP